MVRVSIASQTKTKIWSSASLKWHICEVFTVFLKLTVSCQSFRQNDFLTIHTPGRAGAAHGCYPVPVRARDLLLMPALWTRGEAQDLVLCFPKGLQRCFHLMDAAGGVALVPTEVRASSTSSTVWVKLELWVTALPQDTEGLIFYLLGTAGCAGHSKGLYTLPGQGAAHLGSASHGAQRCLHHLRVINQFLRCDKLCEPTLCDWKKLLLTFAPLTFHHRCKVKISSKVKIMSDSN